MKNISSEYKNGIYKFGRQIDSKITYELDGETIELSGRELNSVSPHYESGLLKSAMKQLDIDSNVNIPLNTILNYQFGVLINGEYEYINYGNYVVYKVERQEDTLSYKITCYDKMLYAMKDYVNIGVTYPITIRNYINELCTYLGLTFANIEDEFANYDKVIQNELYLNNAGESLGYTFRDVFDELAQVTASTICINNNDELEIRYINNTQSKNLFNFNTFISSSNYAVVDSSTSNSIVASVTQASTWASVRYRVFNLKENTNYSLKYDFENSYNSELYKHTWVVIKNPITGSNIFNNAYYDGDIVTFNTGNNEYLDFLFHVTINAPAVINTLSISNIQLEEGSNISNYEPYGLDTINEKYLKDINVNFGEKYGPINSIVLSRASEADNVYLRDEESVEENGICEIKIKENQIMNFNDRADYLEDILEKLNGLEYYINDFSSTGITYYELCDLYNISIDNNIYKCIMFNDEINVTQGLEELIHTDRPEESETDYTKADKTDRKINQTYIIADKQRGEIEALTSRTQILEDEAGNTYTKEEINQLLLDPTTGLINTFTTRGGNNIFRNTGLWFENSGEDSQLNPYEFWNGNVIRYKEDKASNNNALLLQNAILYQEQELPNGTYTISFKYKKLIELSTIKCLINDKEYILTEQTDTEFEETIEVSSRHINIKFTSDTNNSCEIYDLMVNIGNTKAPYSQNQNETTTNTVNISKGITITSTDIETTFKADADGVRIFANTDLQTPKTKFTDKGMETDYLETKEEAIVVDVLIQRVGNHTWFTKI